MGVLSVLVKVFFETDINSSGLRQSCLRQGDCAMASGKTLERLRQLYSKVDAEVKRWNELQVMPAAKSDCYLAPCCIAACRRLVPRTHCCLHPLLAMHFLYCPVGAISIAVGHHRKHCGSPPSTGGPGGICGAARRNSRTRLPAAAACKAAGRDG